MSDVKAHTLIIGYGNPGRQDDGLGPALIEKLRQCEDFLCENDEDQITLADNYQLTVEDALDLCEYERVIFVDAAINIKAPYHFYPTEACTEHSFGSHSVSPEGLLQLASTLYQKEPEAYVLAIRGKDFDDFEEALSEVGKQNLDAAFIFLRKWLQPDKLKAFEESEH